jgi:hypothetical protein
MSKELVEIYKNLIIPYLEEQGGNVIIDTEKKEIIFQKSVDNN